MFIFPLEMTISQIYMAFHMVHLHIDEMRPSLPPPRTTHTNKCMSFSAHLIVLIKESPGIK